MQSDWSNTPKLDYATNNTVATYYGSESKWYRTNRFKQFYNMGDHIVPAEVVEKLKKGDTVKIGIDYYGMLGVSRQLIPQKILSTINFDKGEVLYMDVFIKNKQIIWKVTK